jgi:ribosomal-protein-alanine N-acetyltransferase
VVSPAVGTDATVDWTLRRMIRTDLAAILEIEHASYPSPWSRSAFEHELVATWAAPVVAIEPSPAGERIVGYACCWHVADEVQLLNVAVHPARRRHGVGQALVREVLRQATVRQARAVLLEVRVANLGARRLYARLGFRPTGIRRGYYGPGQDGVLMEWRQGG